MQQPLLSTSPARRYAGGAIALHWIIAALIVANIVLGVMGRDAHGLSRLQLLQLHKSIGLSVLVLTFARLAWRLTHRPPALPQDMPRWERPLAHVVHVGLYVIMFGLPLSGWAVVSAHPTAPAIRIFDTIPWPWFPFVRDLAPAAMKAAREAFSNTHVLLGRITLALILLHVAGAVKHTIFRDGIVWRMLPLGVFLPRRNR
jgi:cytochrome b561